MKFFEDLKKKIKKPKLEKKNSVKQNSAEKNKNNEIPKELLDKLQPGVRIKRIEIGPKQIIKGIIYLAIFFSILSALKNFLVAGGVTQVPISKLIEGINSVNNVARPYKDIDKTNTIIF